MATDHNPSDTASNKSASTIDDTFIASVYQKMLSFATSQLGDASRAQDVVQDALMAALNHSDKFQGQATFKTWVFAILKNKIIDDVRKNDRYVPLSQMQSDTEDGNSDEAFLQLLFDDAGNWYKDNRPKAFDNSWCDPETQAHGDGFWEVLEVCLSNLPADQARVFLMKEYVELDTSEICEAVNISSKNFYVLMHRARLRLQQCLSIRWFDEQMAVA